MASQTQVSTLFKTLGARISAAHTASANVPVNTGGGIGLPGGVNNGVAQLKTLEFIEGKKEEDKGKFYFRAGLVVKSPEVHEGIKLRGKQDSKLIPFFDTPKRQNKKTFLPDKDGKGHWVDFRDLMEVSFGVKSPPAQQSGETAEAASTRIQNYYQAAVANLLESEAKGKPIFFEFRTWQPPKATDGPYKGKESQVLVTWGARCECVETGAAANPAAGVGPAPSTNGQHAAPAAPPPTQTMSPTEPFTEPPQGQQPTTPPTSVAFDDAQLTAWAEAVDADPAKETDDGREAFDAIVAICKQVGVTDDEAAACADWAGVVGLIRTKSGGAQSTGGVAVEPAKGALVTYKEQAGCEVTSVNADAKTVTLKGPDKKAITGADKRLLKVAYAELS